ncbi:MAG: sporulation peptidase YabG [Clostridia bacterium]|nr:sporulation peptidase YabG [Clostridia bacterium]
MTQFRIGDIVARKSYNYDVLFRITNIKGEIVDLIGITVRIVADAPIYDLKYISKEEATNIMNLNEKNNNDRLTRTYSGLKNRFNIRSNLNYINEQIPIYTKDSIYKKPGVVLHIDGDVEYARKCKDVYKRMGLTAHVYNIPEAEQPRHVYNLLTKIRPNILVITGHDAFIRKKNDLYNIDNYKNSRYFIESVLEARRYEHSLDNLVIFAGACQSYYEAIISAGANFASAPKRVLIDMLDPIIVAQTVAYTPVDKFAPLAGIISNTREGLKGIGGVQTRGQYREGMPGIN